MSTTNSFTEEFQKRIQRINAGETPVVTIPEPVKVEPVQVETVSRISTPVKHAPLVAEKFNIVKNIVSNLNKVTKVVAINLTHQEAEKFIIANIRSLKEVSHPDEDGNLYFVMPEYKIVAQTH